MSGPFGARGGFSIAQVMVAAALVAGLAATVAQLSNNANQASVKTRDASAIASIRAQVAAINQDQMTWLTAQKAAPGNLGACLIVSGSTYSCPAATTVSDTQLLAMRPPAGAISAMSLVSVSGQQLAGSPTAPQYYDANGIALSAAVCPATNTNANCRFRATGYMIRDVAATNVDPQNVTFVVKLELNPTLSTNGTMPFATVYDSINLATLWRQAPPPCSAGFIGFDNSTPAKRVCYQVTTCAGTTQFSGWDLTTVSSLGYAAMRCLPYAPYANQGCPAGQVVVSFGPGTSVVCN